MVQMVNKQMCSSRLTQRTRMCWRTWTDTETRETNGHSRTHTHNYWSSSLPLLQRVSSAPVLDPLLPFLPTGKVILSTPSETNAYITTDKLQLLQLASLMCACLYGCVCVCACTGSLIIMHAQKKQRLDHMDYIYCKFNQETHCLMHKEQCTSHIHSHPQTLWDNGHCCIMQCVSCHFTQRTLQQDLLFDSH